MIIHGKSTDPISNPGAEIVALREENQESWKRPIKHAWNGAIVHAVYVNFNFDKQTITMLALGKQICQSEDNRQMITCGDSESPITVRRPDRENDDVTPEFFCKMAFHYYTSGASWREHGRFIA